MDRMTTLTLKTLMSYLDSYTKLTMQLKTRKTGFEPNAFSLNWILFLQIKIIFELLCWRTRKRKTDSILKWTTETSIHLFTRFGASYNLGLEIIWRIRSNYFKCWQRRRGQYWRSGTTDCLIDYDFNLNLEEIYMNSLIN